MFSIYHRVQWTTGALAIAALADVGNKIFVLIISYTIAMKWFYEVHREQTGKRKSRMKDLLIGMANEPANIVIVVALLMLVSALRMTRSPRRCP